MNGIVADNTENNTNGKPSYWLKKLHKREGDKVYKKTQKDVPLINHPFPELPKTEPETDNQTEKILEEKGKDEHTKNQATKVEEERLAVDQLVKSSNRCIISISSLFPWDFFPNTINVEEGRVTFIFRQFLSSQSHSVDINDISNIFIESSFLFATLQIVSKTFVQNDIKIGNLNKKQAIRTRMIIEGLRTLSSHGLNTSSFEVSELISKIEEMHASQGGQVS